MSRFVALFMFVLVAFGVVFGAEEGANRLEGDAQLVNVDSQKVQQVVVLPGANPTTTTKAGDEPLDMNEENMDAEGVSDSEGMDNYLTEEDEAEEKENSQCQCEGEEESDMENESEEELSEEESSDMEEESDNEDESEEEYDMEEESEEDEAEEKEDSQCQCEGEEESDVENESEEELNEEESSDMEDESDNEEESEEESDMEESEEESDMDEESDMEESEEESDMEQEYEEDSANEEENYLEDDELTDMEEKEESEESERHEVGDEDNNVKPRSQEPLVNVDAREVHQVVVATPSHEKKMGWADREPLKANRPLLPSLARRNLDEVMQEREEMNRQLIDSHHKFIAVKPRNLRNPMYKKMLKEYCSMLEARIKLEKEYLDLDVNADDKILILL
ncbi:hypothetical protein Pmani_003989 [Petrolisthes manimaculis]|uniref:Uncharacterized protein n=1 Tax=Petrolisthes manimaculis TaxID=1843537 RepID=A0AAE1QHI0_9EUCA|nr:hypothetical protein Pmani_003989 [Petrolisthes manimaculis]